MVRVIKPPKNAGKEIQISRSLSLLLSLSLSLFASCLAWEHFVLFGWLSWVENLTNYLAQEPKTEKQKETGG